jgi:hypothetical protein
MSTKDCSIDLGKLKFAFSLNPSFICSNKNVDLQGIYRASRSGCRDSTGLLIPTPSTTGSEYGGLTPGICQRATWVLPRFSRKFARVLRRATEFSYPKVRCGYCCRIYFYQYFIVLKRRFLHLFELKHIRWSVLGADNSFHKFPPNLLSFVYDTIVMTTFPLACPFPRYRSASAASLNG